VGSKLLTLRLDKSSTLLLNDLDPGSELDTRAIKDAKKHYLFSGPVAECRVKVGHGYGSGETMEGKKTNTWNLHQSEEVLSLWFWLNCKHEGW